MSEVPLQRSSRHIAQDVQGWGASTRVSRSKGGAPPRDIAVHGYLAQKKIS
jgi:hypothetical protein